MKRKVTGILFTLLLVLSFCTFAATPVLAADLHVYPGDSIQAAIDGAADGDVIYVHEGTYTENLLIDGVDVCLVAVGDVTIEGSTNGYYDKTIAVYNSTCTINGFNVKNNGSAIYARGMAANGEGAVNVTIINNYVSDYIKNGITVNGDLAKGSVMNNTIVSDADSVYAQNGIQFGYGATGRAHHNVVDTDWYLGEDWTASGILVFEADKVSVKNNYVTGCQTGIAVETWGWYCPTASGNVVVNNTIENAGRGVCVSAYAWDGYSEMDSFANNNKVVNNVITAVDGEIGVCVGAYDNIESFTPEADNNKVINNRIAGFEYDTYFEGDIATKVHANKQAPMP